MNELSTEGSLDVAADFVRRSHLWRSAHLERQMDCLSETLQLATKHRNDQSSGFLERNKEVLQQWMAVSAAQRDKNKQWGHLFNPLRAIPIGEVVHSRLLGNLLDPEGDHDQGALFLQSFLGQIGVPEPERGRWMLSVESGRVDLCLWRQTPASVIVIENKSNFAFDQPNQLYRYWYNFIYKPHGAASSKNALLLGRNFQILYIVPEAGKVPSEDSLTRPSDLSDPSLPERLEHSAVKILTFRDDIAMWLASCQEQVPPSNLRLRCYLQFYREIWHL